MVRHGDGRLCQETIVRFFSFLFMGCTESNELMEICWYNCNQLYNHEIGVKMRSFLAVVGLESFLFLWSDDELASLHSKIQQVRRFMCRRFV